MFGANGVVVAGILAAFIAIGVGFVSVVLAFYLSLQIFFETSLFF
jgi:hypothetical protein